MALFHYFLLVSLSVSVSAINDEQRQKLDEYQKACVKQLSRTKSAVYGLTYFKRVVLCVSKTLGFIDDNGDLNTEKIKPTVEAVSDDYGQGMMILSKCAVKKDTPEDTAYDLLICLRDNLPYYHPVLL